MNTTTNTVCLYRLNNSVTFTMTKAGPVKMTNSACERATMTLGEARARIARLTAAGWEVRGS